VVAAAAGEHQQPPARGWCDERPHRSAYEQYTDTELWAAILDVNRTITD
jgi:hypothetical protein